MLSKLLYAQENSVINMVQVVLIDDKRYNPNVVKKSEQRHLPVKQIVCSKDVKRVI